MVWRDGGNGLRAQAQKGKVSVPIRYYLVSKTEPEAGPVHPDKVDVGLCEMLGRPVDEVHYVKGWWDLLGYVGACGGLTSPRVREILKDDVEIIKILDYLDEKYVLEVGR